MDCDARSHRTAALTPTGTTLLGAVAALVSGIGVLATVGPARRSLAIQPTEALRSE